MSVPFVALPIVGAYDGARLIWDISIYLSAAITLMSVIKVAVGSSFRQRLTALQQALRSIPKMLHALAHLLPMAIVTTSALCGGPTSLDFIFFNSWEPHPPPPHPKVARYPLGTSINSFLFHGAAFVFISVRYLSRKQ